MSDGYQITDQFARYFITLRVVDWIDVFSRKTYCEIILENLKFCVKQKGLIVYSYVIMTNHLHLIVRSEPGKLSDTIRDFKSYTAKQTLEAINFKNESRRFWMLKQFAFAARRNKRNSFYQFWEHGSHPIILFTPLFVRQKCHYPHENPIRAGFVSRASDWLYSSAIDYEGEVGLMEVCLLEEMYSL